MNQGVKVNVPLLKNRDLATEAQFKDAAYCLQSLPAKCGFKELDLVSLFAANDTQETSSFKYGSEVLYLGLACNSSECLVKQAVSSTQWCFKDERQTEIMLS